MQKWKKEEKKERKNPKTHTLRQVVGSKPGGRFPLGIGSICKKKKMKKTKENEEKKKKKETGKKTCFLNQPCVYRMS